MGNKLLPVNRPGESFHFPPNMDCIETADGVLSRGTMKYLTIVARKTDDETIRAIIEFAKEEGITDLRVLNGPFILAAIKEKMERDGIGCGFLADKERPDCAVPWTESDDADTGGNPTVQG